MVVKLVLTGFYHKYMIERDDLNIVREVENERGGVDGESRKRRKDNYIELQTYRLREREIKKEVVRF